MVRILLALLVAVELFALSNRGGGPLMSHLVLTGMTFCAVAICFLWRAKLTFRFGAAELGYGLFFLFFLLSLVISLTPEFGLSELLLFANCGILYFIFSAITFSQKDLNWLIIGILFIATADTLAGYFIYTLTPFPRFAGTFLDLSEAYTSFGNDFANFLLLILPVSLWQVFRKYERRTSTLVALFSSSILLSGFVLTFSRGAWISAFGLVAVFMIWMALRGPPAYRPGRQQETIGVRKILVRLGAVAVLSVALIALLQHERSLQFPVTSLLHKATFTADEGSASASERVEFWKGAVQLIKENPLFGTGVLSFKYLYPPHQPVFGINWDHPHDIFLKIGVENGIFAMTFFALFIFAAGLRAVRFFWQNPWHPALFLFLGAVGAFTHNLIDFNFIVGNFTVFMVFIAATMSFIPVRANNSFSEQNQASGPSHSSCLSMMSSCIGDSAKQLMSRLGGTTSGLRLLFIVSLILLLLGLHEGFYNIDFKRGREALKNDDRETAINLLERAQNLFFKRDLVNYLAMAYDKSFKEKEEKLLQETYRKGTVDASIPSRLAELADAKNNPQDTEKYISKSIQLDPQNRLKYYYQLADAEKKLGKKINIKVLNKILTLLGEYTLVLQHNEHMTILSDNPFYASKLYWFLGMKKENDEFDKIWQQQYKKFMWQYGAVPKRGVL